MPFPTLEEALRHLRITLGPDTGDEWNAGVRADVQALLDDAHAYIEGYCNRKIYDNTGALAAAILEDTAGPHPMVAGRDLRRAMLLLIGAWNENREAVNVGNIVNEMPFGVRSILERHRKGLGV